MIQGKFFHAEEEIINMSQNIYPEFHEKLLSHESLSFYIVVVLLICFKRHVIHSVQTTTSCLTYKLIEDNPEQFEIIESYSKCRFAQVCLDFDFFKVKISEDPLIAPFLSKMNSVLKENIIQQIVKSSTSIPLKTLSELVNEPKEYIKSLLINMINSNTVTCKFDDITNNIVNVEVKQANLTVEKVLESTGKFYFQAIEKLIK